MGHHQRWSLHVDVASDLPLKAEGKLLLKKLYIFLEF